MNMHGLGLNWETAKPSTKSAHPIYHLRWGKFNFQPVYVAVCLALKERIDESAR